MRCAGINSHSTHMDPKKCITIQSDRWEGEIQDGLISE